LVFTLQDHPPEQVDTWKVYVPPEHVAKFHGFVEFENWAMLVAALANLFCDGNKDDAASRLVLKHEAMRSRVTNHQSPGR